MRVGLVGGSKGRASMAAPAVELYASSLFAGRRRFVETSCDLWFILSALHGLLDPHQVIEPYEQCLVASGAAERRGWAERVLRSVDDVLGNVAGATFEIHAGATYRDFGLVDGLHRRGAEVVVPAAGLSQGQQLAFYARRCDRSAERAAPAASQSKSRSGRTASTIGD
ncbi:MAG TPA: hypothetical protein VEG38_19180 [Acidimicrobiia bacterium]|nr:hypothetical protein [Acidimicrobiia bacterium]